MPTWKQRTSTPPSWSEMTAGSPSWSGRAQVTGNQKFYLNALFGGVAFKIKTVDGSYILISKAGIGSSWKTRVIPF